MSFQAQLEKHHFLSNYWQKKPLLIRGAFINEIDIIDGNTLAGLACDVDIESRLILADDTLNNWNCEFGHFDESRFSTLTEKNWTLLVQSVDHFLPEIKALQNQFNFIPKWRLDDVMISYATQNGGVGPHFDYYDVFLIQTSGSREWKIGQHCNSTTPIRKHEDLKLLESFEEVESYDVHAGDVLYIPAGIAHWGTALSDDCITTSIGFRAPSHQELLETAGINLGNEYSDDLRYRDNDLTQDKDDYKLSVSIQKNILSEFPEITDTKPKAAIVNAFAQLVTQPRHTELFIEEDQSIKDIELGVTHYSLKIRSHPNTRSLYIAHNNITTLWINAQEYKTDLLTAKAICNSNYTDWNKLDKKLIKELINYGYLYITDT